MLAGEGAVTEEMPGAGWVGKGFGELGLVQDQWGERESREEEVWCWQLEASGETEGSGQRLGWKLELWKEVRLLGGLTEGMMKEVEVWKGWWEMAHVGVMVQRVQKEMMVRVIWTEVR